MLLWVPRGPCGLYRATRVPAAPLCPQDIHRSLPVTSVPSGLCGPRRSLKALMCPRGLHSSSHPSRAPTGMVPTCPHSPHVSPQALNVPMGPHMPTPTTAPCPSWDAEHSFLRGSWQPPSLCLAPPGAPPHGSKTHSK